MRAILWCDDGACRAPMAPTLRGAASLQLRKRRRKDKK
jgi:hypothetical protein